MVVVDTEDRQICQINKKSELKNQKLLKIEGRGKKGSKGIMR